jgi:hypothetical protein
MIRSARGREGEGDEHEGACRLRVGVARTLFTPDDGDANTQVKPLKLKRKRR